MLPACTASVCADRAAWDEREEGVYIIEGGGEVGRVCGRGGRRTFKQVLLDYKKN